MRKHNDDLREELEDINEQVQEKIAGKTKKKRESNERLCQATQIYHDELFLTESYLNAFLSIGNFSIKLGHFEHSSMSIDNFRMELEYRSVICQDFAIPFRLRLISRD
jgi:hypothetical protein